MCSLVAVVVQHTHYEHYISIVGSQFNFRNSESVNGYKFTLNSNQVRLLLCVVVGVCFVWDSRHHLHVGT